MSIVSVWTPAYAAAPSSAVLQGAAPYSVIKLKTEDDAFYSQTDRLSPTQVGQIFLREERLNF